MSRPSLNQTWFKERCARGEDSYGKEIILHVHDDQCGSHGDYLAGGLDALRIKHFPAAGDSPLSVPIPAASSIKTRGTSRLSRKICRYCGAEIHKSFVVRALQPRDKKAAR